jgi:hypothetical protein
MGTARELGVPVGAAVLAINGVAMVGATPVEISEAMKRRAAVVDLIFTTHPRASWRTVHVTEQTNTSITIDGRSSDNLPLIVRVDPNGPLHDTVFEGDEIVSLNCMPAVLACNTTRSIRTQAATATGVVCVLQPGRRICSQLCAAALNIAPSADTARSAWGD